MARKIKGMDKKLFEETKKRLQNIFEYTTFNNIIDEDGEEQPQDGPMPPEDGQQPPMDNGGEMPPMNGGEMPPQDNPDMGGQMPPQDGAQGLTQGFMPQGGEQMPQDSNMAPPMDTEVPDTPGAEDNVVDISELTDAQEETQKNVEDLGNKFSAVMKKLSEFEQLISGNDTKIEDLKAEFEKRNPTQIEKMSMNTAKGGPFTVSPKEYWDEKEQTSNYRREDDNNGVGQGQYVITANDVNGSVDWDSIAKSLDDDFIMHQTLDKAFKF